MGARTVDPVGQEDRVVTHAKFRIWLRPDGIVVVVWVPGTTTLLEDAIACLDAVAQVSGGRRRPLMVDMRDTGPQDRRTRAELTSRDERSSAIALVVGTPLSRMLGNLLIMVNRPRFPVRLFDNEESALAWLKHFARATEDE